MFDSADIVDELEYAMKVDREPWDSTLYQRAADEIRRLRYELDSLDRVFERAADVIERREQESNQLVRWIVNETGYPIEVSYINPVPEVWQKKVEDMWLERQEPTVDGDALRAFVASEGGWE